MLQQTTALRKIASLKKKIWVIRGSQGSAKTYSILTLIINHASSKPDKEIFIISAELTKMRFTIIKDFVKLMKSIGIYNDANFLAGTLYRFPNGSFIKFIGLDKEDVGKGLRSDIAYFNEINKCDQESYEQVASRAKRVIMDYNPDAEFFVDTDVIPDKDCDFLQLTFEDNELLDLGERNSILKYKEKGYNPDGSVKNKYFANKWQVYGLGNIGSLQGVVFENWETIPELPTYTEGRNKGKLACELLGYGMDFGFSSDPTALVALYKWNKDLIAHELIYDTGLTNSMLVARMDELKIDKYVDIIADSADPKSIADISNMGYGNIYGAKKGADSIQFGINKLQEYKVWVTESSKNLRKELTAYKWDVDKNGKSTGKPIDSHNHILDSLRYVSTHKLSADYFDIS